MTLLRPTAPRGRLRRVPLWVAVVASTLVTLTLVGLALLLAVDDGGETASSSARCDAEPRATDPPDQPVTVNVYNATDRAGLARSTATEVAERGFVVGRVDNDPLRAEVQAAAEVRHGPGAVDAARWVAAQVRGAELRPDGRTTTEVDLVLGDAFEKLVGSQRALRRFAESAREPGC